MALWDIHSYVPENARDFLSIHAGVVGTDRGALLLPAQAETGKSTLTLGLLEAGFDYLSDELAALDPVTGKTFPFARHVSLDDSAMRFFPGLVDRLADGGVPVRVPDQRFVRPEDVGARIGSAQRPRWIVFLEGDREGVPRLASVTKAGAVERLAANAFNLRVYRDRGVVLLSRIVAESEAAYSLTGGTVPDRTALLAERFLST